MTPSLVLRAPTALRALISAVRPTASRSAGPAISVVSLAMLAGIALLAAVPASVAVELYVSPEVPTTLGVPTYTPNQALRFDSGAGTYTVALTLPPSASIDALHRLGGPDWLVSFETPTTIGVVTYDPRDVVRTNGAVASVVLCGAAAGVPVGSNVDAVEQLGGPGSPLALSFDIPTTVGAFAVEPADLLIMRPVPPFGCGDYVPVGVLFDGSATAPPIPISSDLSAAGQRAGNLIFALDVPTSLGGPPVVPGQLTSWNGGAFAPFLSLPGWPSRTIVNALAFPTDPGDVPVTMTAQRVAIDGSVIRLTWSPSCSSGAEDYGIYEGALGTWYSHTLVDCSDDFGDLTEDIGTTSGNRYYLVVPRNGNDEGSYGRSSAGAERPVGTAQCIPTQVVGTCP